MFAPLLALTTFSDDEEAFAIANDGEHGLGSGICSRAIHTGRVWFNCYYLYPAHASFDGYKNLGMVCMLPNPNMNLKWIMACGEEIFKATLCHLKNT